MRSTSVAAGGQIRPGGIACCPCEKRSIGPQRHSVIVAGRNPNRRGIGCRCRHICNSRTGTSPANNRAIGSRRQRVIVTGTDGYHVAGRGRDIGLAGTAHTPRHHRSVIAHPDRKVVACGQRNQVCGTWRRVGDHGRSLSDYTPNHRIPTTRRARKGNRQQNGNEPESKQPRTGKGF